jgi:anti-sigma B factor antagonist
MSGTISPHLTCHAPAMVLTIVSARPQRPGPDGSKTRPGTVHLAYRRVLAVSDNSEPADLGLAQADCRAEGCVVVRGPAEIDLSNAGSLRDELTSAVDLGSALVIADLTCTAFCDCAGVTALLAAGEHAARQGAALSVVACRKAVLRAFELTDLPRRLEVYPTVVAAVSRQPAVRTRPGPGRRSQITWLSHRRGTAGAGSGLQPDRSQSP